MKNLLYLLLLLPILLNAQVGIGTTDPKAKLDIRASNQATPANNDGLLIPKIDEYPTTNPTALQDGMLVFVTGNGSITKGFYYWDNASTSWITVIGVKKIDDLLDAKSDNDGTNDGSSIFIGVDAGASDDSSNNQNVGIGYKSLTANTTGYNNTANGYQTLYSNTTGYRNTANGYQVLYNNTEGTYNAAVGYQALASNVIGNFNVALGHKAGFNTNGNRNVFLGYDTGANGLDTKEGSVFIGARAGFHENNSNRLYIENTTSSSPLIYGEFDNDLLRVNGNLEVQKTTDASITVKTPFGNKSSLKLMEGNGTDYGFEFEYDGSTDRLHLWSRTFSGNEAERMTWLKNGRVGISTTAPNALLDVSSTNPAAPKNTDGMLVPRIDAFPSSNPTASQNGMLVFLTTDNKFYYWRNSTTSWASVGGVQKINDLSDGKSDNDGTDNGSSIFLGIDTGLNDDGTDNGNVGVGYQALYSNTIGHFNTANGSQALYSNTTGGANIANGTQALFSNTTGDLNTANGHLALYSNTTGARNTANGFFALLYNTTGARNTANGSEALYGNTTGARNTANGNEALFSNTTGARNTANGSHALVYNTTGSRNTASGDIALAFNTTGDNNVAIGRSSLQSNTIKDNNTAIGAFSDVVAGYKNSTALGYLAVAASSNQIRIGSSSVAIIGGYTSWSVFSDKRIKTNIKEDIVGLEFIKKLHPVSYNYNMDAIARFEKTPDSLRLKDAELLKTKEVQTGFIAQEVEAAAKEAGFNFHGVVKPHTNDALYAIRYSEFVVPLVKSVQELDSKNEILDIQIQEQQTEIELLKKEIQEIKKLLKSKK